MAIRNPDNFATWLPALFDGQFHWDFLFPAFRVPFADGRGMSDKFQPMDFDSVVERNGRILIFETKDPGKAIPKGQAITLGAAWIMGATIFHVCGKRPQEISGMAVYAATEPDKTDMIGIRPLTPCDATDVIYRVRRWMCWANGEAAPSRETWDNQIWLWDHAGKQEAG
jgi:hypothetical protein